jgi:hypothetical protein
MREKIKRVTRKCTCCDGTGRVELTGVYADTYAMLSDIGRETNGAGLAIVAGCSPTAMCNRLAALERLGVATSRRYGRQRLFKAAW